MADFCTRLLLFLPVTQIDEALEAIGEISHAENMEYSSDAQSSRPATATQALLTNLGVCLRRGDGSYIGTSDIDTVALYLDGLT
ncbi:hypothetical protein CesoFtcFv8_014866 [Champsocephalus esox]|uniref:Uncharacterized protein n=1 Tax=Champsocephalus esox TaxID=159716 RepID=A0AAN8BSX4_9TELE|nr:hypothetical protein CesoFtcFv8_014866 [Champsocephalus esox]